MLHVLPCGTRIELQNIGLAEFAKIRQGQLGPSLALKLASACVGQPVLEHLHGQQALNPNPVVHRSSTCTFLTLTRVSVSSSNLRPIILAIESFASADLYGCCFQSKLYGRGSSCSRSILAAFSAPELEGCPADKDANQTNTRWRY